MMRVRFSKKFKVAALSVAAIAAFAVGIFLECCDKKEFVVAPVPDPTGLPENVGEFGMHYDDEGRLDVNLATEAELDKINGIGEKMAKRIIDYRNKNGEFMALEELTLVSGIGEVYLEKIRHALCVR